MANGDLLKTFAEVGGIGGLGMGLFLLVVKEVLKKINPIPTPDAISFFRILNRIIAFAFILALVGLIIFAVRK
jgi:hypothetical protein